jgi:phosphoribosyl 1,2-cyclic phosphodiesterase
VVADLASPLLYPGGETREATMENGVRFWGVRGSIPAPGPATARVGGNTSCVEVRLGHERIVLDAGSGLRQLGQSIGTAPFVGHLLLSHLHWDHIQGLPFFLPLFSPRSALQIVGPPGLERALRRQMSGPTFPVGMDIFAARLALREIEAGEGWSIGEVQVQTAALQHPGGALGYRLQWRDRAVVYACDHEHGDPEVDTALRALCRGADLLIYDAQYLPEEYPRRRGWGHSTFERGAELARAAEVGALILTHHDPTRDDRSVDRVEQRARRLFAASWVAREGDRFSLDDASRPSVRLPASSALRTIGA